MAHRLFIVDVFAEARYAGNQLAVIVDAGDLTTAEMQQIARETNFSETTFLTSTAPHDGGYAVRIFTPGAELPFAGHPTLGTAWVIRNFVASPPPSEVTLQLGVGPTPVRFAPRPDGAELAWMRPRYPTFGRRFDRAPFAELLGLEPDDCDPRFPVEEVSIGVDFTFVPLKTLAAVRRARFRMDRYEQLAGLGLPPAIFLFCPEAESPAHQIHARMFAGALGVGEDPATGSANAGLAAWILRHGYLEGDSLDVRVEQGYEIGRPSLLYLRAERRGEQAEIEVGGRVLLSLTGELV